MYVIQNTWILAARATILDDANSVAGASLPGILIVRVLVSYVICTSTDLQITSTEYGLEMYSVCMYIHRLYLYKLTSTGRSLSMFISPD